jgi:branched-chain amino acid transport system substrate-binding protein
VADQLAASDPQRPVLLAYAKRYQERFGQLASAIGGNAYDALVLFARALETAGADRAGLRDALEATRDVIGITGIFTMTPEDHNGLSVKDLAVARVQGGRQVLI